MKIHITNLYGQSSRSTALIAQNMVTDVATTMGFKEIGIYSYPVHTDSPNELNKRIDGMFAAVGSDDIVIAQFPTWNSIEFDTMLIDKLLSYRDIKVAIFIHDVVPLMFENNYYLMPKFIELCNKAQGLILPTRSMFTRLEKEGLKTKKIVFQGLWDHLSKVDYHEPNYQKTVNFIGSASRFPFVKDWHFDTRLQFFGDLEESDSINKSNIDLKGWMSDDELMLNLSSGFGLVWSEEIDNQKERTYSMYNLSYKLSSYLAAGLPIIVNEGISTQMFLEKNGIGLVANSLSDVDRIVKQTSIEEYQQMVRNVKKVSYLIKNGYFTKKLLIDTVYRLLTE
ncbi:sugar transferase [Leuconostoc pseudomesenteroides]|uniref:Glucosyltransferase 3 n=1 Tax=Leuconostoc pseudomesenteroides TaxID=33968 RepID=A0ABT6HDJ4_LEUPS|nr:sugar transferase [Leuconostoc pseudomesenteroides]MDG9734146.1 sugar transferase [Leuconostoc pseudomesenteroides]NKZ35325.1 sugar transferase [Leuconostoc pseudomesenteroides]QQB27768.1 sugar transferase [Leuconostoc pseudomesenteroides]